MIETDFRQGLPLGRLLTHTNPLNAVAESDIYGGRPIGKREMPTNFLLLKKPQYGLGIIKGKCRLTQNSKMGARSNKGVYRLGLACYCPVAEGACDDDPGQSVGTLNDLS